MEGSVPAGHTVSMWATSTSGVPSGGPSCAIRCWSRAATCAPSASSSAPMNVPIWPIRSRSPVGLSSSTSRRRSSTDSIIGRKRIGRRWPPQRPPLPHLRYWTMRAVPPAMSAAICWKMPVSEVGLGRS